MNADRRAALGRIAPDGAQAGAPSPRAHPLGAYPTVRLRRNREFGDAAASITDAKRRRLRAAALHYIASLPAEPACRFDAIVFDALDSNAIEWLRDIDVA